MKRLAIPSSPTDSLGGDHEESAGRDHIEILRAGDVGITEETPAINRNEYRLRRRAWSTEESEESDPESGSTDDASVESAEITEGGWICRVERFEKHVNSRGHITVRHPHKRSSRPLVNRELRNTQNTETLQRHETERRVPGSIISYIHHAVKSRPRDHIEPEIYIEIHSPLIIEVLRQNNSYGV